MKYLDSLFFRWKKVYHQQGESGKLLIACLSLLVFSFLWVLPVRLFRSPNSSVALASEGIGPDTFESSAVLVSSTALPARPRLPASSPTLTRVLDSATQIVKSAAARGVPVVIIGVDKLNEFVDIQNVGKVAVNLSGWLLVSETGNQVCALEGVLHSGERMRVWSTTSMNNPGFSCGFPEHIWKNNEPDPAVLYKPDGREVSRYP